MKIVSKEIIRRKAGKDMYKIIIEIEKKQYYKFLSILADSFPEILKQPFPEIIKMKADK